VENVIHISTETIFSIREKWFHEDTVEEIRKAFPHVEYRNALKPASDSLAPLINWQTS
jgi:hypothetical protein